MRVLIVALALVATPFLASAAQQTTNNGRGHDAAHCARRDSLNRSGQDIGHDAEMCPAPAPQPPPPPPPPPTSSGCVNSTSATGTPAITGKVYESLSPWPGLAGWCVQLTGTITGSAVTDANGNYVFTGLPDGTYTVCEVLQSGWVQTSPSAGTSCPTGFGYTFNIVISAGQSASFVNFGNAPATP